MSEFILEEFEMSEDQRSADYEIICPSCGCKMKIHASGEDKPGFKYGDTARCHCGQDLGTPWSNPFSIWAEQIEKGPNCNKS